jgi:hypothetical protein
MLSTGRVPYHLSADDDRAANFGQKNAAAWARGLFLLAFVERVWLSPGLRKAAAAARHCEYAE